MPVQPCRRPSPNWSSGGVRLLPPVGPMRVRQMGDEPSRQTRAGQIGRHPSAEPKTRTAPAVTGVGVAVGVSVTVGVGLPATTSSRRTVMGTVTESGAQVAGEVVLVRPQTVRAVGQGVHGGHDRRPGGHGCACRGRSDDRRDWLPRVGRERHRGRRPFRSPALVDDTSAGSRCRSVSSGRRKCGGPVATSAGRTGMSSAPGGWVPEVPPSRVAKCAGGGRRRRVCDGHTARLAGLLRVPIRATGLTVRLWSNLLMGEALCPEGVLMVTRRVGACRRSRMRARRM